MKGLLALAGIISAVAALGLVVVADMHSSAVVEAHGTGNLYGNNVEFGATQVEDADTARKVEPREITISVGESVTFHVNGGHQVVVLKPKTDPDYAPLEDLGSEGVNLDEMGVQTPLPPQIFPNSVADAGLGPRSGPGL